MCSQSDRSALKKKLKEIKKCEEKGQRKGEKRLKEEKNAVLEKECEEKDKTRMVMMMMMEEKAVKEPRCSGKTVRTESLL